MKLNLFFFFLGLCLFTTSISSAVPLCESLFRVDSSVFSRTLDLAALIVSNDLALQAAQEVIQKSQRHTWISPTNPFLLIESIYRKSPSQRAAILKASPMFNGTLMEFTTANMVKNIFLREEFFQMITDYIDSIFNRSGQKLSANEADLLIKVLEHFEKTPTTSQNGIAQLPVVSLLNALREVARGGSMMWEGSNPIPSDLESLIIGVATATGIRGVGTKGFKNKLQTNQHPDSMW